MRWSPAGRIGGAAAAAGGLAWLATFGGGVVGIDAPLADELLWLFPLAFGAGTIGFASGTPVGRASSGRGARSARLLAGILAVGGALAYVAAFAASADSGAAYAGWLVFVLATVALFGVVLFVAVVDLRRRRRVSLARLALAVSAGPVAFIGLILGYKILTGWWVTDPTLIAIGGTGATLLVGGGWVVLGLAIWHDAGVAYEGTSP